MYPEEVLAALRAINQAPANFRQNALTLVANYIYWRIRTRQPIEDDPPKLEDHRPQELRDGPTQQHNQPNQER